MHGLGDEVLNITEHLELVLAHHVLPVGHVHPRDKSTERRDSIALSNSQNRSVDVGRAGFQSSVSVGDGAAGIVVEVGFNVARDDGAEGADEFVDLARVGAADSVGDTDASHTELVNRKITMS